VEDSGVGSAFNDAFVIFFAGERPYHKTFILSNLKPLYPRSGWYHRYNGLSSPFKP